MAQYRYVGGGWAQIVGTKYEFTSYGQLVDMPEELVAEHSRLPLITAEEFDAIHPGDEVKKYSRFASHVNAPEDFLSKRAQAWAKAQSRLDVPKQEMPQ